MKCGKCGTNFTGYLVKAKVKYYYKCNLIGCRCNRSAPVMHNKFVELLSKYHIDKCYIPAVKQQAMYAFESMCKIKGAGSKDIKSSLAAIEEKIERVQERYVLGEIEQDLYQKFIGKYEHEKQTITSEFDEEAYSLSNSEN